MTEEQRTLIVTWHKKTKIAAKAHCHSSVRDHRNNQLLGIPVVALTTIAGTSVFLSLQNEPSRFIMVGIGLLSLIAAVLATLQTYLQYAQRAAKHREVSVRFEVLQKTLEQLLAFPPHSETELDERLTMFRKQYEELSVSAPNVPDSIWNAATDFVDVSRLACPPG